MEFLSKFGFKRNRVKTRDSLKIKVSFTVRNRIKEPHFGIAIFREDGVYCYGPNTGFEGYYIPELKPGKGSFTLKYERLLLAPGNYRVSVAIWDKNEKLAFNYHDGYYKLAVYGYENKNNELLNIPFKFKDTEGSLKKADAVTVKLFDSLGNEKDVFITNEPARFNICSWGNKGVAKPSCLWLGIYRDDGVYCQGIFEPFKNLNVDIFFPKLCLLPGKYSICAGLCNSPEQDFLMRADNILNFHMVYTKQDHGTVYLTHSWNIKGGIAHENTE